MTHVLGDALIHPIVNLAAGELLTGIFYMNPQKPDYGTLQNMVDAPLAALPQQVTRPGKAALAQIMEELT